MMGKFTSLIRGVKRGFVVMNVIKKDKGSPKIDWAAMKKELIAIHNRQSKYKKTGGK